MAYYWFGGIQGLTCLRPRRSQPRLPVASRLHVYVLHLLKKAEVQAKSSAYCNLSSAGTERSFHLGDGSLTALTDLGN
jgi:hypothetical protein